MLYTQEVYIDRTQNARFGETDIQEYPYADTPGELFRNMRREYGRCTGHVYIDREDRALKVGWVFVKRMKYEDARSNRPEDFYLREVWVTVYEAPPKVTRA